MSIIVTATIQFSIPVEHLPPDIPGMNATPEQDAAEPISGAEQVAYDFLTKLQPLLPDGVYPILNGAHATKIEKVFS